MFYIQRAILRYRQGDVEGARADGNQAIQLAPVQALVHPEAFLRLTFKGNLDWVLDHYEQAIQKLPDPPLPYRRRADAYRVNGDAERAVIDYTRAIQLAPRRPELYLGRGRAYQQQGARRCAAQDFHRVLKLSAKPHLQRQARSLLRATGSPLVERPIDTIQNVLSVSST